MAVTKKMYRISLRFICILTEKTELEAKNGKPLTLMSSLPCPRPIEDISNQMQEMFFPAESEFCSQGLLRS